MSHLAISGERGEEADKSVGQERNEEFRRAAVEKFYNRGHRSVAELAQVLGVSSWSLYHWAKRYGNAGGMKRQRRPGERSAQEKLRAVIEYEAMPEDKRGEYLRREGLQSDHIEGWKKSMEAGLGGSARSAADRSERAADKKKIEELEREIRRKDKALAETTALLVLKKKADLIWGGGENE
jgi:transposase